MKFIGVVLLSILSISAYFSWTIIDEYSGAPRIDSQQLNQLNEMIAKSKVDEPKIQTVEKLQKQVLLIESFRPSSSAQLERLIAIAPTQKVIIEPKEITLLPLKPEKRAIYHKRKPAPKVYKPYHLSMVFISDNNRYAVIDDRFSRVGDTLQDGGKVMDISEGKVVVKRGRKLETFLITKSY